MQFTLIVTMDPEQAPAAGSIREGEFFSAFFAFNAEIEAQGVYVAGEPLQPVETATTVRMKNGELILTDGPFAETKEQIGGFYLVECTDVGEAIEWGSRVPVVPFECGAIEVRPCMDYSAEMKES
ncbi:MAG: YciI family protein [Gaiellaceae bacterium]